MPPVLHRFAGWQERFGVPLRLWLKQQRLGPSAVAYLTARVWLLAALGTTVGLLGLIIVLRPAQQSVGAYAQVDPGVAFDDIVVHSPSPGKALARFRPALAGAQHGSPAPDADDADSASPELDAHATGRVRNLRKSRQGAAWLTGRIEGGTEPVQTASPVADERTIQ